MSKQLGPIEVVCDAPPYAVVRGCRLLGFHSPEDVRWCRLGHLADRGEGWGKALLLPVVRALLGVKRTAGRCSCGAALPRLRTVCLSFNTGEKESYVLGQCARCNTVFWEPA